MDSDASKAVPGYLKIVSNASSPYTVELISILPGATGSNFTLKGDCQPYFSSQQLRMVTLPSNAFQNMGSVSTVTLPATLTTIGNSAFSGCTRLTNVQLPEGLETIEAAAFRD